MLLTQPPSSAILIVAVGLDRLKYINQYPHGINEPFSKRLPQLMSHILSYLDFAVKSAQEVVAHRERLGLDNLYNNRQLEELPCDK